MYPSPLKDDGYDISDYMGIHPDYGDLEDFKAFVNAAHDRGLRVITDLVMNHTSDQHSWFQNARKDRNSPYRDYYVWSDTGTEYADTRIIFLDVEDGVGSGARPRSGRTTPTTSVAVLLMDRCGHGFVSSLRGRPHVALKVLHIKCAVLSAVSIVAGACRTARALDNSPRP